MGEDGSYTQLQMVWPERLLDAPPVVSLPPGYALRTYRPGDEARFFEIMAVHQASGQIVTTAIATHDPTWLVPFCGEVGWVAGDPATPAGGWEGPSARRTPFVR